MASVVRALALLSLVAINLRTVLGSFGAAGTALAEQLPGGGAAVGLTSSISIALIALGAPASAALTRRYGIDPTVLAALVTTGVALGLVSLEMQAATWAAAVLGGLAAGVLGALLPALARTWLPQALGTAVGVMMAATSGGLAVASVAVSSSLETTGSWSLATGGLAVLAVAAAAAYGSVARRRHPSTGPEVYPSGHVTPAERSARIPRWAAALTGFLALQSFVLFSQIAWLAPTVEATGGSAATAGAMLGTFSALQVLAALATTHYAQRHGRTGVMMAVASVATALGTGGVLLAVGTGSTAPWWGVAAMSLGHGASFALANFAIAARSPEPASAARTGAVVMFVSQGSGALGPVTVGILRDSAGGLTNAWLVLLTLGLAQFAFAMAYVRTCQSPQEPGSAPAERPRSVRPAGQRKLRPSSRR